MGIPNPFPSQLARLPWHVLQRELLEIAPNGELLRTLRAIGHIPLPRGHSRRRSDAPAKTDTNQYWFVSVWRLGHCGLGLRAFELQLLKLQQRGFIEKRFDSYKIRRYRITLAGVMWLEAQTSD